MPPDTKSPKVVARKGDSVSAVGSGDKTQITVVASISVAGFCVPPMVIWDRKTFAPELTVGEIPDTIYGLSSNGWMDQRLFDIWFTNHFLRYAPSARPVLLLMDGYSSRYCPDTVRLAAQEKIILFALSPIPPAYPNHSTKGVFDPLKVAWRQVCHQ